MSKEAEQWMEEILKINDEERKMTEKQAKIIRAAIEIFSQKGYASSSTSEIALKAGVAEGTIFRHYRTKKELLLSIIAPTMTRLIAPFIVKGFQNVLDDSYISYEDFLRALIINRQNFVKNNIPIIKILLQEIPFQPELREQFEQHIGKKLINQLKQIVEHFQKKGEIVTIPSSTVIRMTGTTIMGFFIVRYLLVPFSHWDDEKEIDQTVQFIMYGLSNSNR